MGVQHHYSLALSGPFSHAAHAFEVSQRTVALPFRAAKSVPVVVVFEGGYVGHPNPAQCTDVHKSGKPHRGPCKLSDTSMWAHCMHPEQTEDGDAQHSPCVDDANQHVLTSTIWPQHAAKLHAFFATRRQIITQGQQPQQHNLA